jgi:hypothetical protein
MNLKKYLIAGLLTFSAAVSSQAVLISDFSALPGGAEFTGGLGTWGSPVDQFTVSGGVLTIGPVSGGSPDNAGYFGFADIAGAIPLNATGLTQILVTAQVGASNVSPGFIVNFFDLNGDGALTATLATSAFTSAGLTTQAFNVVAHPGGGDITNIGYFGIAGTGSTQAFNFLISDISLTAAAIPEPSTYAVILGAMALGLVAYRRRQQAA